MESKNEISKAISAHTEWKNRLRAAIENGSSDFKPEIVQQDNQCEFGYWLAQVPPAEQSAETYQEMKALHASFHQEAAHVLSLALAGKKDEANQAMSISSKFNSISSELAMTLFSWREK